MQRKTLFPRIFIPATQKVVACYVIPSDHLNVRPGVRPSVSASLPISNFSIFFGPIFLKLCMGINIGKEWYWIAKGLTSFFKQQSYGP